MVTPKGDEDIKENSIQQYRNQNAEDRQDGGTREENSLAARAT